MSRGFKKGKLVNNSSSSLTPCTSTSQLFLSVKLGIKMTFFYIVLPFIWLKYHRYSINHYLINQSNIIFAKHVHMYFSRSEFEILHEPGEIARFDCLNPAIYILIMNHLTAEISCIFGGSMG